MKTSDKKEKPAKDGRPLPINREKKVRGSGFTYSENKERTDKSVSMSEVKKEEIVQLPDLGQKNRP
jgi:hypothetical protein